LRLHIAISDGTGELEDTVGQGGFTVVDVGDYRKISDVLSLHLNKNESLRYQNADLNALLTGDSSFVSLLNLEWNAPKLIGYVTLRT
jgi:hypothetical protein